MSDKIEQAMMDAMAQTLENMAFMEVLPCEEELRRQDREEDDLVAVDLLVHDPVQGEFRLSMSRGLAGKIAEAVFGQPQEELTDQILGDILSEILNTVAGLFMTDILAGEQTFQLGLPEFHPAGVKDAEPPAREWCLHMNNEPLFIKVWGDLG